jgi:hypothetical protein
MALDPGGARAGPRVTPLAGSSAGAAMRDGTARTELPPAAATAICLFWEKIGALTRAGHVEAKLLRNGRTRATVHATPDQLGVPGLAPMHSSSRADAADAGPAVEAAQAS